jgi:hypothetical protein
MLDVYTNLWFDDGLPIEEGAKPITGLTFLRRRAFSRSM